MFGVGAYFKRGHVQIEGPYNTYVRDTPEARKVRNHFCPTCGTTVFWEADLRPDNVGVAVGAFADSGFFRPTRSIWEASKHGWVAFAHDLPHLPRGRSSRLASGLCERLSSESRSGYFRAFCPKTKRTLS